MRVLFAALVAAVLAGGLTAAAPPPAAVFVDGEHRIHPFAIRKFECWISDSHPNVASIFTRHSLDDSNEYFDQVTALAGIGGVAYEDDDPAGDGYAYEVIGVLDQRCYVVHAREITAGTAVFHRLMLLAYGELAVDHGAGPVVEPILSLVAHRGLGDRFRGEVRIEGDAAVAVGVAQGGRAIAVRLRAP